MTRAKRLEGEEEEEKEEEEGPRGPRREINIEDGVESLCIA